MPGFPSHTLTEWLGIARKANDEGLGFSILPSAAQHYIKQVEALVGVPCTSVGLVLIGMLPSTARIDLPIDNIQKVETPGMFEGAVAQLEERLVCNQKAGGSNPPVSTRINLTLKTTKLTIDKPIQNQVVNFWFSIIVNVCAPCWP